MNIIRVVAERPALMEDYPELSFRVRGAFGRQLASANAAPARGRPQRATAYDILFAPVTHRTASTELPKPAIVRAWVEGHHFIADLHLIGFADGWLDDAAEALMASLAGGIALRGAGGMRVEIPVHDTWIREPGPIDVPASLRSATLSFRSPVTVRRGAALATDARAIIRSIPRRVASLARWQGCLIDTDWGALATEIERLEIDDRHLHEHNWQRYSTRSGSTPIPMRGYLGRIGLTGYMARLAPFLAIGQHINTGSHASIGAGWFDLALFP